MPKIKVFRMKQLQIDALKNRCFNGASKFSYFRKGEWTGVETSIDNAAQWAAENPGWVMSAVAGGAAAVQLLKDVAALVGASKKAVAWVQKRFVDDNRLQKHVCRRVICSSDVLKAHITEWEEICGAGSVVTIRRSEVGPFSYLVSDKMWAIFSRFGPNDLRGIEGTDKETIAMLKERFDSEFYRLCFTLCKRRKKA